MTNKKFNDKKMWKSFINLKYLAFVFMIIVFIIGFGLSTYYGIELLKSGKHQGKEIYIYTWGIFIYIVTTLIILGIFQVFKMLKNLTEGKVFTYENANILKKVDNLLIINMLISLIINVVMVFANFHNFLFLIVWIVYIGFLLAGHTLVNPLSLIVEKSADMQIEMELTI